MTVFLEITTELDAADSKRAPIQGYYQYANLPTHPAYPQQEVQTWQPCRSPCKCIVTGWPLSLGRSVLRTPRTSSSPPQSSLTPSSMRSTTQWLWSPCGDAKFDEWLNGLGLWARQPNTWSATVWLCDTEKFAYRAEMLLWCIGLALFITKVSLVGSIEQVLNLVMQETALHPLCCNNHIYNGYVVAVCRPQTCTWLYVWCAVSA